LIRKLSCYYFYRWNRCYCN